jgi:hypothetical protein
VFKLIYKTIVITVFLVFVSIALAMWKGGEPFRIFGDGLTVVGKSIMKFGDLVDEFIDGGKKLRESYDKLKDVIDTDSDEGTDREK